MLAWSDPTMAIQNAVTLVVLVTLIVLFDFLVESKALPALAAWEIVAVYFAMGIVSGLVLRGGIMLRLLYIAVSALVATIVVELILGSDPAYPFVRVLFMLPVGGVLLLGAVVGIAMERVLGHGKKKLGPQE